MKNTLILFAVFCIGLFGSTNAQELENGAKIEFEKDVHDYGTLKQGGNGFYEFVFTNTGNAPLILSNVKGSCQCTVPSWPKEPIAEGKSAVITVKYNTDRVGAINKSVTINSNAVNEPTKVIRIKGNVEAVSSGIPENTSGPAQN